MDVCSWVLGMGKEEVSIGGIWPGHQRLREQSKRDLLPGAGYQRVGSGVVKRPCLRTRNEAVDILYACVRCMLGRGQKWINGYEENTLTMVGRLSCPRLR